MRFFTYEVICNRETSRIGKGGVANQTDSAVVRYLQGRYGIDVWDAAKIAWHFSESAALKAETLKMEHFVNRYGRLPLWNRRHGGGGRQIYPKCKICRNDALNGNYGFCGIHR